MRKAVTAQYNLAALRPDLLKIWSPENPISPDQVAPKASFVAKWICGCGNEWEAPIRNVRNASCKKCNFNRAISTNNFAIAYPDKVKLWSPKNDFKPEDVTPKSGKRAWWICSKGHEWNAIVSSIANGTGCPFCAGQRLVPENSFARKYPNLAKFWDLQKNKITPDLVSAGTSKKFWFICDKGHSFDVSLNNATSLGRWCRYCAGQVATDKNNILKLAPELAEEWHPKNKTKPSNFLPQSHHTVWWLCNAGHEWKAAIYSRYTGSGCPYCGNKKVSDTNNLAHLHPELLGEYDFEANKGKDPKTILAGTTEQIWWKCKFGHKWKAAVRHRTGRNKTGCPECSPQASFPEIRFYTEIEAALGGSKWRGKLEDVEIDIWLQEQNIAIEYDGSYYHSRLMKKDEKKNRKLEALGQLVIRIREKPLKPISENDFMITARANLDKNLIDEFLCHLAKLRPSLHKKITAYKKAQDFLNDELFRKLVSYLPGPQPEDSLLAQNPRIAAEWNFERNMPLRPEFFHSGAVKSLVDLREGTRMGDNDRPPR